METRLCRCRTPRESCATRHTRSTSLAQVARLRTSDEAVCATSQHAATHVSVRGRALRPWFGHTGRRARAIGGLLAARQRQYQACVHACCVRAVRSCCRTPQWPCVVRRMLRVLRVNGGMAPPDERAHQAVAGADVRRLQARSLRAPLAIRHHHRSSLRPAVQRYTRPTRGSRGPARHPAQDFRGFAPPTPCTSAWCCCPTRECAVSAADGSEATASALGSGRRWPTVTPRLAVATGTRLWRHCGR